MTESELTASGEARLFSAYAEQEPVKGAIDLGEAMARAVLYNLDDRVQRAEALLRSRELVSANVAMLPGLAAEGARNVRNNVDASTSYDVYTAQQSLAMSTSQDKGINTGNVSLAWNVLDLGLSWVHARQAGDQALAAQELRRRTLAKIVEDVRTAYWKALAAEYLAQELPRLEARARTALEQSRTLVQNGNVSPLTALSYQKEIYDIQDRVQIVQAEVVSAKSQLAALMNLPPGTRFSLVRPKVAEAGRGIPAPRDMLKTALQQRPEVREAIYQARIADLDGTAVLIDTLPGINVFLAPNYTSNSFTLNNNWVGLGAQASWNLMKVFSYPVRQAQAEAKKDLAEERVKALGASIALQVVVSRERYEQARRRLQTASDFRSVQADLLKQLAASATAARSGDQELVREEMSALLARARYDVALADVQSSLAVIQTTLGRDPYPVFEAASLPEVAAAFRAKLAGREPKAPPAKVAEGGIPGASVASAPAGESPGPELAPATAPVARSAEPGPLRLADAQSPGSGKD